LKHFASNKMIVLKATERGKEVRGSKSVFVCVCVRERERERERIGTNI